MIHHFLAATFMKEFAEETALVDSKDQQVRLIAFDSSLYSLFKIIAPGGDKFYLFCFEFLPEFVVMLRLSEI